MYRLILPCVVAFAAAAPAQTARWLRASPTTVPMARTEHCAAYDPVRGRVVIHGGENSQQQLSFRETWEFDGVDWTLRASGSATPPFEWCESVFDAARQRVVLVASLPNNTTTTWEWDGSQWQLRSSGGPPGRYGHACAYDSARNRTVLFGGNGPGGVALSDTWEWNGTSWLQRSTGGPPARNKHAMAFDAMRGVTVLFGGHEESGNVFYADTWEWNGTSWTQRLGGTTPSPRFCHMMAYDAQRGRTVLFGGGTYLQGQLRETWEWNGSTWTNVAMPPFPPSACDGGMVFDGQRMTLFGGSMVSGSNATDETWHYVVFAPSAASYVPFGSGCPGPAGTPALAAAGGSLPRLGQTLTLELSNLPPSPFNVPFGVLSFEASTWNGLALPVALDVLGLTGCSAWIEPQETLYLANNLGTATWQLAVPLAPNLIALSFYTQAGVLVPGWNPASLVVSNAGHGVVGSP